MPVIKEEKRLLSDYLKKNKLKATVQRELMLETFIGTEGHLSAEELFDIVRKKDPSIGLATVFRAFKVFVDAGLAQPVDLKDKKVRYEHKFKHGHHDHLICASCGRVVEFFDRRIEELQEAVCKKYGYRIGGHSLEITGLCPKCKGKAK